MSDAPSEERLNDYVDGLLSEQEAREVERALAAARSVKILAQVDSIFAGPRPECDQRRADAVDRNGPGRIAARGDIDVERADEAAV